MDATLAAQVRQLSRIRVGIGRAGADYRGLVIRPLSPEADVLRHSHGYWLVLTTREGVNNVRDVRAHAAESDAARRLEQHPATESRS